MRRKLRRRSAGGATLVQAAGFSWHPARSAQFSDIADDSLRQRFVLQHRLYRLPATWAETQINTWPSLRGGRPPRSPRSRDAQFLRRRSGRSPGLRQGKGGKFDGPMTNATFMSDFLPRVSEEHATITLLHDQAGGDQTPKRLSHSRLCDPEARRNVHLAGFAPVRNQVRDQFDIVLQQRVPTRIPVQPEAL